MGAASTRAAEYANCIPAEGEDLSPDLCPRYDARLHLIVNFSPGALIYVKYLFIVITFM